MKKNFKKLFYLMIIFINIFFVGCSNNKDNITPNTPPIANADIEITFKGFEKINDLTYSIKVSNETENLYLTESVEIDDKYTWKLCEDIQGREIIPSKVATLSIGDNTYYVLVTDSKENTAIYTLKIRRKPLYEIIFNTNNGDNLARVYIEEDDIVEKPKNPQKPGYTFTSWNFDFETPITTDFTITAQYIPNIYKIYYHSNNAENIIVEQSVTYDSQVLIKDSNIFEYNAYTQASWNTSENGNGTQYTLGKIITQYNIVGDMHLFANWRPINYQIIYNLDGGTNGDNPSSYNIESEVIKLKDANKPGYTFDGWYTDNLFNNKLEDIVHGSYGNIELFAKFIVNTYKIYYHSNNYQNLIYEQNVVYGNPFILKGDELFTYDAYLLRNWQISQNENNDIYSLGKKFSQYSLTYDLHLFANWRPINYQIIYNLDGGTNGDNPSSYNIESEVIKLKDANKPGYTFDGWYTDNLFNNKLEDIVHGSYGNIELFAKFTINTYKISFNKVKDDADSIEPISVTYNDNFTLPTLNNINGYDFAGWIYNEKIINNGQYLYLTDITITACWNAIFEVSEGIIKKLTTYGNENYADLVIPETIDGIKITMIESCAFSYNSKLTSITMPTNLTTIGSNAFYECKELTSVIFNDNLTTIGTWAFSNCVKLTNITMPTNLTTIQSKAFNECKELTSVIFNDNLTTIGTWAFSNCVKLSELTNLNNVVDIGEFAFENCISITSISIDNVVNVSRYLFSGCSNLEIINISNVKTINEHAFYNCSKLKSIYIGANLTYVGNCAFDNCSISNVYYENSIENWCKIMFKSSIFNNTENDCSGGLFINNEKIENITIDTKTINSRLFQNCFWLKEVILNSSVETIDVLAFRGCSNMEKLTISENIKQIKGDAFGGCKSIKNIYYNGTIEDWCQIIFDTQCSNPFSEIEENCNFYIKNELVSSIEISNISTINAYAFYNCGWLKKVTLDSTITTIGEYAFYDSGLEEINIAENITNIGSRALVGCYQLRKLILQSEVIYNTTGTYESDFASSVFFIMRLKIYVLKSIVDNVDNTNDVLNSRFSKIEDEDYYIYYK